MTDKDRTVVTLDEMLHTSIGSLINYSPKLLYQLQKRANDNLNTARKARQWLENAIGIKYEEKIRAKRSMTAKDTGVIHIDDNGYRLTSEIKKKIIWEQEALANLAAEIANSGDNVSDYIEITYHVYERKYNEFSEEVRKVFDAARQIDLCKPSYILAPIGDEIL